jgi:hypothetical protein
MLPVSRGTQKEGLQKEMVTFAKYVTTVNQPDLPFITSTIIKATIGQKT